MRNRRATFIWAVCALLGVILAAAGPAADAPLEQPETAPAKTAETEKPTTLTFVTYNVLADQVEPETRIPALLKLLEESKADVIALQEVAPWVLKELDKAPWTKTYHATATINGTAGGGLYILSRWPLHRTRLQAVPSRQGRALLAVEIDLGGESLGIATCHLESPLADHELRARQLQMADTMLKNHDHGVLLGDFNFGDGEEPETKTIQPFEDAWKKLKPDDPGYTWNKEASEMAEKGSFPGEKSRRIDRVIMRSKTWTAAEATIIGDKPLKPDSKALFPSDHFGLRVVYKKAEPGK